MEHTEANSSKDSGYSSVYEEDSALVFIGTVILYTIGGGVSFLGIWSNIFSMIIFYKLGLKDSMSVEFFALSFTDLLVALVQFVSCTLYILGILYPDSSLDIWSLTTLAFGYTMLCFYFTSCWITTVISIERCLCVVYPFKVKLMFTRSRCTGLIL
ncbi:unnamed protein product, partial [Candidula unifasciata]